MRVLKLTFKKRLIETFLLNHYMRSDFNDLQY